MEKTHVIFVPCVIQEVNVLPLLPLLVFINQLQLGPVIPFLSDVVVILFPTYDISSFSHL